MANLIYLFRIKCQEKLKHLENKKRASGKPVGSILTRRTIERRNFLKSKKVVKQKTTLIIYIFPLQFQEIICKVAQLYQP